MMIPAMGGEVSPLTIFGKANVPWWCNIDNRVDGSTPPGIETETNLADPTNCNITQPAAGSQPFLTQINDRNWADFIPSADHWELDPIGTALWPIGAPALCLYAAARFDTMAGQHTLVDIGVVGTGGANTGITLRSAATNRIFGSVFAGGALSSAILTGQTPGELAIWRVLFADGFVSIRKNREAPVAVARAGTMTNAGLHISVGRNNGNGGTMDGAAREFVLTTVNPTAQQDDDAMDYLSNNSGIAA